MAKVRFGDANGSDKEQDYNNAESRTRYKIIKFSHDSATEPGQVDLPGVH